MTRWAILFTLVRALVVVAALAIVLRFLGERLMDWLRLSDDN